MEDADFLPFYIHTVTSLMSPKRIAVLISGGGEPPYHGP
jgi:hypothetical protein